MASPSITQSQTYTNNGNVTSWGITTPTLSATDALLLAILTEQNGSGIDVTGITDADLTWSKRQAFPFINTGHSAYYSLELWSAPLAAQADSDAGHTATIGLSGVSDCLAAIAFGVAGLEVTGFPVISFDPNGVLLTDGVYNGGAPAVSTFSTSENDDLLLWLGGGFYGGALGMPATSGLTWTSLANCHTNHANYCGLEVGYCSVSAAQVGKPATAAGAGQGTFVDALTSDLFVNTKRNYAILVGM